MSKLSKHIQAEEEVELPILEKALSEHDKPMSGDVRETTKLAKSFRRTQLFIPSRAHPWMPNKPPFESVVGLLFTPFDTLGDMFRKFPDDADLDRTEGEYMEWKDEHRAED